MLSQNKPLTTGEIAKYCGVSRMGVWRWIKEGHLKAHRTPGGHYRILPHDFETFLSETDFPSPKISAQETKRVLVVTQNTEVLGNIVRMLSSMPNPLEIDVALNEDAAIAKMAVFQPAVVIFDGDNCADIVKFVGKVKSTVQSRNVAPALLLSNITLHPTEITRLAEVFSPIVVEPALPTELTDDKAAHFAATVRRLLD